MEAGGRPNLQGAACYPHIRGVQTA